MMLTHPWFLLGIFSVAIPVAIHFFELRRPQRLLFTNVGFIREIKLVTARQRKLKHLLILLTRIAFITFLVFMFCQPFIPAPQQEGEGGTGNITAIVDSTPSMVVEAENAEPLFSQATEAAQELAQVYPASTRFLLPTVSNSLLTATAFQTTVQELAVSGQSGGLGKLLKRANNANSSGHTFVFSDFQKGDFNPRMLRADSITQLYLVPLQGKSTANVYVDSVLLEDAFVRTATDIGLRIRLRNGGATASADCQVKVFVGNRQVAAYQTAIKERESTTSIVRVRLEGADLQACRVEVEDFPVTFDNKYYFTLQASPQLNIVGITQSQTDLTSRVYNNEALFSYASSTPQGLSYTQLDAANLLVLQGVPKVDNTLRENLRRAVGQGATLVIVPPVSADGSQEEYNRLFRDLGMGGIQWEKAQAAKPTLQDVATPDLRNPFFKDVFTSSNQRAVMPKVAPVLRWSRSGTEVMKMRNGDSFLAEFPSGKGKVYLFSAPFQEEYSNFIQHALFVPVMYRLAMQSYQNKQHLAYRLNQGALTLGVAAQTKSQRDEPVVSLQKDSLTVIPSQRWEAGSLQLSIPAVVQEPGFYQVVCNNKVLTTLALNIDKAESELAYYTAAELRQIIGPNRPNIQVYENGTGRSAAAYYKAQQVGTPLWRYCLLLALACLLAEVVLLRLMGARKPASSPAVAA
ncbi:BatA domain-containing protein [Hymenobacter elongatus]|uniref:Aerotolerance regulator N-terminal domain-containing protein n=1 Tax=Hymenobacter elongatus TaxID=877208 RepID=A0A4Z0PKE0_9BACT|nr:BatA domain-containing protein [Hymenobacter elongatus]TGE15845.1 hypothetical protein E5J99_11665 [Hymenobacter elongatus]